MDSVRAGSALSSPRITRTGWPLMPPLALMYADHARSAGGAGPDTAPRPPDSAPKEPSSSSDFGPPLLGAGVAAPFAREPVAALEPVTRPLAVPPFAPATPPLPVTTSGARAAAAALSVAVV